MKRVVTLLVAAAFVAASGSAAIRYKSRTYQEGAQTNDAALMNVEAWVDDDQCDIRMVQSGNPFMAEGTRLVCRDAARKIFLVNDKEKTFSEWDLDKMFGALSNVMANMGEMMKFSIENARVETLLKEDGGNIAGYPTTHYRFRTEYDFTMKMFGMGQAQHVVTLQDAWYTTALDDVALGVWLMRDPPDFGDTGFAELIELERSKAKGWPLKTIIEQVTEGKRGRSQTTRTITEVTEISEGTPPPGTYEWGSDYRQVDMMPDFSGMEGGQGPPEKEKKGGLRGLLKKGGGG